jgi:hypothetical protein
MPADGVADDDSRAKATLVRVAPGTAEYNNLAQVFANGGFPFAIETMERVQNRYLWEHFVERRRQVQRDTKGDANEAWMLHGSRATPPSKIYDGVFGFDFRYAEAGMYGRGAYFAELAEYSHGYRHSPSGQQGQMFVARVVRGRIEERGSASDKNIRHPAQGYHSVRGLVTATHNAVITYELHQAYPAYLITYRTA